MIDAADLINVHRTPGVLVLCGVQMVAAFFILTAVAERRALTPRPYGLPSARAVAMSHGVMRVVICSAYIGIIFGAGLSGFGVLSSLMGWAGGQITSAQNDLGVLIRTVSGAIILPHILYLALMLASLLRKCQQVSRWPDGIAGPACQTCPLKRVLSCDRSAATQPPPE